MKRNIPEIICWIIGIFFVVWFVLLFTSCRSVKHTTTSEIEKEKVYVYDTITRLETVRDTTFIIERDLASIIALVKCDSNNQAYIEKIVKLESGRTIRQNIKIVHDTLYADCEKEKQEYKVYYKNVYEGKFKQREQELIKEYNQEVKKRSGAFTWLIWLCIGLIAGFLIKQFLPLILKLFRGGI